MDEPHAGLPAAGGARGASRQGGDVGVLGGRFFSVDVYLGRQLTPVRTEPLFLAFLARPDRPVALLSERVWNDFTDDVRSRLEILDRLRVRRQVMLIVRAREPSSAAAPTRSRSTGWTMTDVLGAAPARRQYRPRPVRLRNSRGSGCR